MKARLFAIVEAWREDWRATNEATKSVWFWSDFDSELGPDDRHHRSVHTTLKGRGARPTKHGISGFEADRLVGAAR